LIINLLHTMAFSGDVHDSRDLRSNSTPAFDVPCNCGAARLLDDDFCRKMIFAEIDVFNNRVY
jgi:hypothetical protein